jgi:hypothetical protein
MVILYLGNKISNLNHLNLTMSRNVSTNDNFSLSEADSHLGLRDKIASILDHLKKNENRFTMLNAKIDDQYLKIDRKMDMMNNRIKTLEKTFEDPFALQKKFSPNSWNRDAQENYLNPFDKADHRSRNYAFEGANLQQNCFNSLQNVNHLSGNYTNAYEGASLDNFFNSLKNVNRLSGNYTNAYEGASLDNFFNSLKNVNPSPGNYTNAYEAPYDCIRSTNKTKKKSRVKGKITKQKEQVNLAAKPIFRITRDSTKKN